jgi:hypothetical protein
MGTICSCCRKEEKEKEKEKEKDKGYIHVTKEDKERLADLHQTRADANRITPIKPINPRNRFKKEPDYDQIAKDWLH